MSLADRVHVARRFQRSIRIDADLYQEQALEGFVCPRSSADVLLTMAKHVRETGQGAFTWTGPYGSGKSSLVVALSALLNGSAQRRAIAGKALGSEIGSSLNEALPPKSKGWRILPVVGRRDNPAQVIGEALVSQGYCDKRSRPWTESGVLEAIQALASEGPRSYGGLVVFIDEMGKFLEGAAQDGHDVYLFQQLAELSARSGRRLVVVGILHQAFQEYANRLSRDLRDEWSKVQGRFVDLIVNTAGDEQLELLSRAIESDRWPTAPASVAQAVAKLIQGNRPGAARNLAETLDGCWPLHPVTAALLGPLSRRRFGQNQRSLFGFLNSAEPFGFQDFLRDATDDALYTPDRLFDYLRINLEPSILASPDGHRWSMAVEAVERCEAIGAGFLQQHLLKAIALIDLFRERSGLLASAELLAQCCRAPANEITQALSQLTGSSFALLRRHIGAYAVFAGSDFDIEQALTTALETVRDINFRELRSLAGLQPVLAKRHYHATGVLRWFDVDIVPLSELESHAQAGLPANGAIGRFLLAIPTGNETPAKARKLCRSVADTSDNQVIVGFSRQEWQLKELAREFLAINLILEERPELSGDQVARREVLARMGAAKVRLEQSLQRTFDTAEWYQQGAEPTRHSYAELNAVASDVAFKRYPQTPVLANELLNRIKPSSNAVAAQKALLKRMVGHEGQARLGINGYPAEGGLFDSLLAKSALYREIGGSWKFAPPPPDHDPCHLLPLWEAATALLEVNQARSVSVMELYDVWRKPPFGVRDGLLPVLAVALMLSRRDRLAFYREGIFQARFTDVEADYLTIDPSLIQLRWMNLSDLSRRILSGLAEVVREIDGSNQLVNLEPIDVARGLVSIYESLRPWAKKTSRLSANAVRIRALFKQANDPNKFLFDDIPSLFHDTLSSQSGTGIEIVIARVREGLLELTQAYGVMLGRLREMLLAELQVPNGSSHALADLRSRAQNIHQLTGDFRLNAFIGRLTSFSGTDEDMEGVASLATNKPPRDWVDADLDQAGIELASFAQRFIHSEAFARVKGRTDKRHALAVIVGRDGRPTPFSREFHVTDMDRKAIELVTLKLEAALQGSSKTGRTVILAALAEVSARYIAEEIAPPARVTKKVARG